ncbi:hypothetical protein [Yaniella sp.]|uniref:hypothetical protein n=1 Tax=Yaniella sp. TaxID=2773929 RepID=UPI002649037A|nr:hypothetical protein [Yaniella sp.]MDN6358431.1 hypothetical protein [Yaniella sp.]
MTALILDVLRVAALGLAVMFLWDVWRLIRKAITAIDRDQDIMDAVETHEPDDDDDDGPQFTIDMSWDEQTAVLEFIEQFREVKTHYERRQQ